MRFVRIHPSDRKSVADLSTMDCFRKPSDYEEFKTLGPLVKRLLEDESNL